MLKLLRAGGSASCGPRGVVKARRPDGPHLGKGSLETDKVKATEGSQTSRQRGKS